MTKQSTSLKSKGSLAKPVLKGSKASKVSKVSKVSKTKASPKSKVLKKTVEEPLEEFPSSDEEDLSESDNEASKNGNGFGEFHGFESTDDESDNSDSDDQDQEKDNSGPVEVPKLSKETQAKVVDAKKASNKNSAKRAVVYVGRIPHGFYEKQMKAYFSQFGEITRLRLSRNKTTGKSKHYAFIEFETEEVAKVVVDTMDSYLLFGHILKVKSVPPEKVHEELFKGANKRYHVVPWRKIAKHSNDKPKSQEQLDKLQEKHDKYKQSASSKLAELGIEYSLESKPKATAAAPKKKSSSIKGTPRTTRSGRNAAKVSKN